MMSYFALIIVIRSMLAQSGTIDHNDIINTVFLLLTLMLIIWVTFDIPLGPISIYYQFLK